jgi:hypothetical protein
MPSAAPTRLKLFGALVVVGTELIALGAQAACALVASREPDASADRHVEQIDRLALRIARTASLAGDEQTVRYALAIRRHCHGYRTDDAAEDGWIGRALGALQTIVRIVRGMNRSLERELARRRQGAGVRS